MLRLQCRYEIPLAAAANVSASVATQDVTDPSPQQWHLASTAVEYTSFGWVSTREYADFCHGCRADVTRWTGFPLMRDICEPRMTCFVVQAAAERPYPAWEARRRVDSLRGRVGDQPWCWTPYL